MKASARLKEGEGNREKLAEFNMDQLKSNRGRQMADRQLIRPDWPWAEKFRISQAVKVGGVVYVAGQVAFKPDGSIAGAEAIVRSKEALEGPQGQRSQEQYARARADMMRAQAKQVFTNIQDVLKQAGATMKDIVKLNAYLIDFTLFAPYAEVRREFFPDASFASTGVEVKRLVHEDLLLEIEVVAHLG